MILKFKNASVFSAAFFILLVIAGNANAGALFAVSGAGGGASVLYKIDPANGSVIQSIGATGFSHVTGLAFDPVTGALFGHVSDYFGSGDTQLLTIDVLTGAGTLVGSTGLQVPDMTFDSTGQLYAWSEFSATQSDDLFRLDKTTGLASFVGESSTDTSNTGLAFDNADTLYMTRYGTDLFTVDSVTGATTFQTSLSSAVNNALTFDRETNQMYSVSRHDGSSFLQKIDVATGTVTELGDIGINGNSRKIWENPGVRARTNTAASRIELRRSS